MRRNTHLHSMLIPLLTASLALASTLPTLGGDDPFIICSSSDLQAPSSPWERFKEKIGVKVRRSYVHIKSFELTSRQWLA